MIFSYLKNKQRCIEVHKHCRGLQKKCGIPHLVLLYSIVNRLPYHGEMAFKYPSILAIGHKPVVG